MSVLNIAFELAALMFVNIVDFSSSTSVETISMAYSYNLPSARAANNMGCCFSYPK